MSDAPTPNNAEIFRSTIFPDGRTQQVLLYAEDFIVLREIALQLQKLNENIEKLTSK